VVQAGLEGVVDGAGVVVDVVEDGVGDGGGGKGVVDYAEGGLDGLDWLDWLDWTGRLRWRSCWSIFFEERSAAVWTVLALGVGGLGPLLEALLAEDVAAVEDDWRMLVGEVLVAQRAFVVYCLHSSEVVLVVD
jgi:hypothetical protein